VTLSTALSLSPASVAPSTDRGSLLRVGMVALGGLGGSSRVACQLARGLLEQGHVVSMLSSPDPWWCPESSAPVDVVALPVPREPIPAHAAWVEPLAAALVDQVCARDIEVLSVHYAVGLAAAAVEARRRLRARGHVLRVCASLHGTDVTHWGVHPQQGPALARALRQCDAVTAVSRWLADRAFDDLDLAVRPEVVANAVDTELFRPDPIRSFSPRPRLCHASNFRPVKRPLDAIEVLDRMHHHGLDAELLMVGDGPLRPAAIQLAHDKGLDARVRFHDPVSPPQLAALLRTADLSLVTSASESFGLFALESMASGTPVLGTRCGGLEEVFAVDPTGELPAALLAAVGDVDDLARRAATVLQTPGLMARLRSHGLRVGRRAFPRDRQLSIFTRVLDRITDQGDRP